MFIHTSISYVIPRLPISAEYLAHTEHLRKEMEKPVSTISDDRDFILSLDTNVEPKGKRGYLMSSCYGNLFFFA